MATTASQHYVGRFAPSPSGDLHFGSLVCALASYLDAKAHSGKWLVRMEDIDPPREQTGAKQSILTSLERHGLHWDDTVIYQSQRGEHYREALNHLASHRLTYPCNCTRKRLAPLRDSGDTYDQHCLHTPPPQGAECAWRLNLAATLQTMGKTHFEAVFNDAIAGQQTIPLPPSSDFIVHRKDGLFAYNLAVVVDDIAQGISHIVRGADLLSGVAQQAVLAQALAQVGGFTPPQWQYAHVPLVVGEDGNKLSKQNRATSIDEGSAEHNIYLALKCLRVPPPEPTNINAMLQWGVSKWQARRLAETPFIEDPSAE